MGVRQRERVLRDNWNWGAFLGNIETQCSGNSVESIRVTLAKSPSNEEYGTQTTLLL